MKIYLYNNIGSVSLYSISFRPQFKSSLVFYHSSFFNMWSSPVRLWQYSYRTALEIAGPHWPKTSERTQVNTSWRTTTAHEPLPLGLCRPTAQPPPLNLSLFSQIKLGKLVSDVPTHEFQQQIENEADIMYVLPTSHPYLHPRAAIMPVHLFPYSRG